MLGFRPLFPSRAYDVRWILSIFVLPISRGDWALAGVKDGPYLPIGRLTSAPLLEQSGRISPCLVELRSERAMHF